MTNFDILSLNKIVKIYRHVVPFNAPLLFILHPSTGNQKSKIVFCGQTAVFQTHVPSAFCQ